MIQREAPSIIDTYTVELARADIYDKELLQVSAQAIVNDGQAVMDNDQYVFKVQADMEAQPGSSVEQRYKRLTALVRALPRSREYLSGDIAWLPPDEQPMKGFSQNGMALRFTTRGLDSARPLLRIVQPSGNKTI